MTLYRWAGAWGPFKVKIPCGECSLTSDVIKDTFEHELAGVPVQLDVREWLTEWWKPLAQAAAGMRPSSWSKANVVSQGHALNRGVLTEAIIAAHVQSVRGSSGSHVFGKASCPHCLRSKAYLDEAGLDYTYHDVVKNPRALYEMLGRVKPIVGPKTPITVPQIWIDGRYIGGADQLSEILHRPVEPNPDRGLCSLSARLPSAA